MLLYVELLTISECLRWSSGGSTPGQNSTGFSSEKNCQEHTIFTQTSPHYSVFAVTVLVKKLGRRGLRELPVVSLPEGEPQNPSLWDKVPQSLGLRMGWNYISSKCIINYNGLQLWVRQSEDFGTAIRPPVRSLRILVLRYFCLIHLFFDKWKFKLNQSIFSNSFVKNINSSSVYVCIRKYMEILRQWAWGEA